MNLRASAIVMKSLPATVWGDALLISREEARRIGYELEQAAERIEALEARAIPDTHRVVPVDALSRIMELAGVALVYQPFGTKDRQHFDALMAIVEDKP